MNTLPSTTASEINGALVDFARSHGKAVFMAEGIQEPTSFFGTLKGIERVLPARQLIELPIAENSMVGVGIGIAQSGVPVVMNFQRVEFILLALEQLFNNAAKAAFLSLGNVSVPLVLRLIVGRGWGQGPTHSQSLESMFSMIPGLKVVMPSLPNYARRVIQTALEDLNPVVVIEHRWCHYVRLSTGVSYDYKPWRSIVVNSGKHLTIAATSYAVVESLAVARVFSNFNVYIEVIDVSCTRPLDIETITASVMKTGHLVTIDTGHLFLGVGSEIVSQIAARCWNELKSAPSRLGLPEYPVPSSRFIIDRENYYPDVISIAKCVLGKLSIDTVISRTILEILNEKKQAFPIDQPNDDFKGPF